MRVVVLAGGALVEAVMNAMRDAVLQLDVSTAASNFDVLMPLAPAVVCDRPDSGWPALRSTTRRGRRPGFGRWWWRGRATWG